MERQVISSTDSGFRANFWVLKPDDNWTLVFFMFSFSWTIEMSIENVG